MTLLERSDGFVDMLDSPRILKSSVVNLTILSSDLSRGNHSRPPFKRAKEEDRTIRCRHKNRVTYMLLSDI